MTKRIVSGVFLLIALGALGLILAGALTSGEQLIVRFLTAIIVAALCLYVISDLRLQADDGPIARTAPRKSPNDPPRRRPRAATSLPPNSTAAFMATVTGKRSATTAATADAAAAGEAADDDDRVPADVGDVTRAAARSSTGDEHTEPEPPAYDEAAADAASWPHTPVDPAALDDETAKDGLVAIFTKQAEREAAEPDDEVEQHALVVNDHYRPPTPLPTVPNLTSIRGGAAVDPGVGKRETRPIASTSVTHDAEADSGQTTASDVEGDHTGNAEGDEDPRALTNDYAELADPHANPEPVIANLDDGTDPTFGQLHSNPEPGSAEEVGAGTATDDVVTATGELHDGEHPNDADEIAVDQDRATAADDPAPLTAPMLRPLPAQVPSVAITPVLHTMPGLEAATAARARVIELLADEDSAAEIDAAIRSGEIEIITALLDDGTLSAEGPISDQDVRTMVFVAFTSSELRKILRSGGRLDSDDLGPVDVFPPDDAVVDEVDTRGPSTESVWASVAPAAVPSPTPTGRHEPVTAG